MISKIKPMKKERPRIILKDILKPLDENGFIYEITGTDKVVVTIDHIRFSLSCNGKDVIWALKIPVSFVLVVSAVFALLILLITVFSDGPVCLFILGGIPMYFLYRYRPSTIRAKRKLLSFLKANFV